MRVVVVMRYSPYEKAVGQGGHREVSDYGVAPSSAGKRPVTAVMAQHEQSHEHPTVQHPEDDQAGHFPHKRRATFDVDPAEEPESDSSGADDTP